MSGNDVVKTPKPPASPRSNAASDDLLRRDGGSRSRRKGSEVESQKTHPEDVELAELNQRLAELEK